MPKLRSLIQIARRSGSTSINLAKRRAWYGEGENAGDQQENQQGDSSLPTTPEGWEKLARALQKRVTERDTSIETLRKRAETAEGRITAIETANQDRLAKQGNFEELAQTRLTEVESLRPVAARAAALEKIIREGNEERIKAIPEQMRTLIPTDYEPEKLQAWLNANAARLVKDPAPSFDAGAGGSGGGNPAATVKLTQEQKEMARAAGMTEKEYAEYLGKKDKPVEKKKPAT